MRLHTVSHYKPSPSKPAYSVATHTVRDWPKPAGPSPASCEPETPARGSAGCVGWRDPRQQPSAAHVGRPGAQHHASARRTAESLLPAACGRWGWGCPTVAGGVARSHKELDNCPCHGTATGNQTAGRGSHKKRVRPKSGAPREDKKKTPWRSRDGGGQAKSLSPRQTTRGPGRHPNSTHTSRRHPAEAGFPAGSAQPRNEQRPSNRPSARSTSVTLRRRGASS